MKNLKTYLQEELFATPQNTIGIGNISAPTNTQPGSGDIPQPMCIDIRTGKIYKRRKKLHRYKLT